MNVGSRRLDGRVVPPLTGSGGRRSRAGVFVGFCLILATALDLYAAELEFDIFRIGTGGAKGTYFPVGTLVARAINGDSERQVDGTPRLVAASQVSNGSVANVAALRDGQLEAALVQADVAYWAHTGTAIFAGHEHPGLRVVANLYPESVHLVARTASGIRSVDDLKGRRVSLDEPGSGTLVEARIILGAFDIREADFDARYVKPQIAAQMIQRDDIDAFFIVAGYPTRTVVELAASGDIDLIPIRGKPVAEILRRYPHLVHGEIPRGAYAGVGHIETLSLGAQLVVHTRLDDAQVYRVTRALWSDRARNLFDAGHPIARTIHRERALQGLGIPLHPGAARYYREHGLLDASRGN